MGSFDTMTGQYMLAQYVEDLRRISAEAENEGEIFEHLGPLARRLAAERNWVEDRFLRPDETSGFSAFLLHEEDDHSLAVFAVSWVPGLGVDPHDHGTWAVVAGVDGVERNIRYKRLDDRGIPEHAELAIKDELKAGPGDVLCIKTGGIHAVRNDSAEVTLSLHTYGRHINHTKRSQFDLASQTAKEFKVDIN